MNKLSIIKLACIFTLMFSYKSFSQSNHGPGWGPGGPAISIEEIFERCVYSFNQNDMGFCVDNGLTYETLETMFYVHNTDKVTFKTDIIKMGQANLKYEHYDITVDCSNCFSSSGNLSPSLPNLRSNLFNAVSNAHQTSSFYTQLKSRNGSSRNDGSSSNSGSHWSETLERVTSTVGDIVPLFRELFKTNNKQGFFVLERPDGAPIAFALVDDNVITIIADLTDRLDDPFVDENGESELESFTFSATFPTREASMSGFIDLVSTHLETRLECVITFTGNEEQTTADVTCFKP